MKTQNQLNRRSLLKGLAFASMLPGLQANSQPDKNKKPNVLFILVDDLSWSDLSFNGSKVYETPNVDKLSKEGMFFSDFYSGGPVCSPTRVSILTGKNPARTNITRYLISPSKDPKHVANQLESEEITIAEILKEKGYATGYFGKWHLGYERRHWADKQGFDVAKGGMDLPWAWKLCWPDKPMPPLDRNKDKHVRFFSPHHLTHLEDGPEGEYLTERLTNETIKFIKSNKKKSFFAYLSFHTVHTPLQAKPEVVEKYKKKIAALGLDKKKESNKRFKRWQNNPNYGAMVQHMDENCGRLLDSLKALGLEKNTIVLWTSDNGGKGSVTSNLPLNGAKHDLREGGIRVPTIVKWPGKIKPNSKNSTPLISDDFLPTILDVVDPGNPVKHKIDGLSFKDVLLGDSKSVNREALYWHYPQNRTEGAIRFGNYKLILFYKKGTAELYNLKDDIGEKNDLSKVQPELADKMKKMLVKWLGEVDAKFPEGIKL